MGAWAEAARRWVRSLWSVWPKAEDPGAGLLAEVEAADLSGDDHQLLRLLHQALRAGHDAAIDRALARLSDHYREVGAWEKAVAMLTQRVARHPEDAGARADLEAAHMALGHRGDAAKVAPPSARGRVEVVHVAPEAAHQMQESLQDTEPPAGPAGASAAGIDDADTDVDVVPRHVGVPADPTAQVDKKMLDVLRRLSS